MEEEAELIGSKSVTGCAVRVEKGLVIFNEVFHLSARTIDVLVDKGGS